MTKDTPQPGPAEHTPTPWEWDEEGCIRTPDGYLIATVASFANVNTIARMGGQTFSQKDAAFICQCANQHDSLTAKAGLMEEAVAALKPVCVEIGQKMGLQRVFEDDWNPEYEIEISLSVAECRAIVAVFARVAQTMPDVIKGVE